MIRIITGPVNSGKSSKFLKLYEEESGDGIGLYSQKLYDEKKTIVGYKLVLLPDKEEIPFIRLKESVYRNENRYHIQGRFAFLKDTFEIAERYILSSPAHLPVWIDEVGKLELKSLGHHKLLRALLDSGREMTITVRDSLLNEMLGWYGIREHLLLQLDNRL